MTLQNTSLKTCGKSKTLRNFVRNPEISLGFISNLVESNVQMVSINIYLTLFLTLLRNPNEILTL